MNLILFHSSVRSHKGITLTTRGLSTLTKGINKTQVVKLKNEKFQVTLFRSIRAWGLKRKEKKVGVAPEEHVLLYRKNSNPS